MSVQHRSSESANPRPQQRAVIFDMDGTMVSTESLYHQAWELTANNLGYTLPAKALEETIGRRMSECYEIIQAALTPDFPIALFQSHWRPIWQELAATEGVAQKPGIISLLTLLDKHAIPKAVATSANRDDARITLEHAGLSDYFSVVVTAEDVVNGKPAPDSFQLAAARLGIAAHHCVALEDSEAGARAAVRAGMRTFMVPDLLPPQPETADLVYRVVRSLSDVEEWIVTEWL